jgi:nitrite reductase (cytochrome c-552)
MIKMQHPEFETWYDGPHGSAGVSCADCHMPYTRMDGKKKVSSHHWHSPLKDIETACRQCHADKDADYLKSRVEYTQKKTFGQLLKAQESSVRAHEAVRLADEFRGVRAADYDALMLKARENVRKGQFYWDFVSAENSVGFHNPAKALDTLLLSVEASNAAVDAAMQATGGGIGKALAGDVKNVVPPVRKHSRKLQQSAAHLASHPWLKYLPQLPASEQVWDGQTWVGKAPEPDF